MAQSLSACRLPRHHVQPVELQPKQLCPTLAAMVKPFVQRPAIRRTRSSSSELAGCPCRGACYSRSMRIASGSRLATKWALVLCVGCGTEAELAGRSARPSVDAGSEPPSGGEAEALERAPAAVAPSCEPLSGDLGERCDAFGDERPDRLSEHSAIYDQQRQEMVVFGGTPDIPVNCTSDGTSEFSAETWIYDDPCGKWVRSEPGPSARGRHAAAWGNGEMWVFGGRTRDGSGGNYTLFDDLLRFEVEERRWSSVEVRGERPAKRAMSAMAYDSAGQRLWLFGGSTSSSGLAYAPTSDLWSFEVASSTWTQLTPPQSPPPRLFHSMVYDDSRHWLVVFGGANETAFDDQPLYFGDLWAFDIEAGEWMELAPRGSGPVGRFWSSLAFDSSADRYVVFGGHDPGTLANADATLGNLNDVWQFSPDTQKWQQLASGDRFNAPSRGFCDFPPDFATLDLSLPERRSAHSLVYSESCGHALLFGGKTDCGSADDVWSYSSQRGWAKLLSAREGEVCQRWREDVSRCSDICF